MTKAPIKIWSNRSARVCTESETPYCYVPYIRADIVEEISAVLAELCRMADNPGQADYTVIYATWDAAKAALKKLEEGNE